MSEASIGVGQCQQDWSQAPGLEGSGRIWVRFEEAADGRIVITGICVEREAGIDKAFLRALPLAAIEARANIAHRRIGEKIASWYTSGDHRLDIPTKKPWPDRFYADVAHLYLALQQEGEDAPAPVIAAANDVPVTTVRGWVRQARRRGHLQPGRPGRVG